NGGTLVTIDRDAAKTAAARERVAAAGLSDVVECKTGVATDVLNSLPGPFDLVLSDADKENCIDYVKRLLPKLADRAVFVTDNTTTHQEQLAGFVAWNRGHDAFYSVGVPVGNGMELSIKCSASDAVST
ncbi:MAG: O-methyltransferase, partial [Phycisphaerae bacterium]